MDNIPKDKIIKVIEKIKLDPEISKPMKRHGARFM